IVNDGLRKERNVAVAPFDLGGDLLHLLGFRVEGAVTKAGRNRRFARVRLARIDDDQAGGGRDVLIAAVGEALYTVFNHADHEIVVHVAHEGIGDEVGTQQLKVIQVGDTPE